MTQGHSPSRQGNFLPRPREGQPLNCMLKLPGVRERRGHLGHGGDSIAVNNILFLAMTLQENAPFRCVQ